jgi:8-oxo-dGTP diphosphatase
MEPKLFVAMKAFIVHDEKVLLVREAGAYADGTHEGVYELPGGRMKPGENFLDSLYREVKEETSLNVTVVRPLYVDEWRPTVRRETWQIVGVFFVCSTDNPAVVLGDEHDAYEWIHPEKFEALNIVENEREVFRIYINEVRKN